MLWSTMLCMCVEDQSPSTSAMVINSVCTCPPVQLSVVKRASCVSPASTQTGGHTSSFAEWTLKKALAASLTEGFSESRKHQMGLNDTYDTLFLLLNYLASKWIYYSYFVWNIVFKFTILTKKSPSCLAENIFLPTSVMMNNMKCFDNNGAFFIRRVHRLQ